MSPFAHHPLELEPQAAAMDAIDRPAAGTRDTEAALARSPKGGNAKFTYASGSRPLEGYTIKRGVGRGGFGEVYYATSDAGKEVALKLIRRNLDVELRGVTQCLNLKHPNLVGLYDIREDDREDSWVVMEYVAGECLEEIIARNPEGMPIPEVLSWMHGIGAGVAYLHDRGIVHRDLKPGNIFCDEGLVKIGDYGLSKFISASRRSGQTESVGTVHYMAPEVANGRYGKEIDIYALGIMLYEMLTGHVPFEGESVGEVLMKHLTAAPDVSRLHEPYRSAVARALAKDPEKRVRSVHELLALLPQPASHQILVNPLATKPRPAEAPAEVEPLVVAQVVPESEEPVMRVLGKAYRELRDSWNGLNLNTPTKVLVLVAFAYLLVAYAPLWAPLAAIAAVSYLIYIFIRVMLFPTRASHAQPQVLRPPTPPSPPAIPRQAAMTHPPPRHAGPRPRPNPAALLLAKSPREKITELLGSMLLSTLVALSVCVVIALLLRDQPQWNQLAWLAVTGTVGSWAVMVPAKFWEGSEGDTMLRRFAMLLVGLSLGLFAYGVDEFLLAEPRWGIMEMPADSMAGMAGYNDSLFDDTGSPSLKGYLAYFAFLFPVVRWWKQADPLRWTRLSIWGTLCCVFWAWLLHVAWPFPQPWGVMVAAIIAVSVQLASPWISLEARKAGRLAAAR